MCAADVSHAVRSPILHALKFYLITQKMIMPDPNAQNNTTAPTQALSPSDLLEYAVDLEIYDLISNSRVEKLDVIEAISEADAIATAIWQYGTTTEVKKVSLF